MEMAGVQLRADIKQALACDDSVWYRHTLTADVSACPLSKDELRMVVRAAMDTASQIAQKITSDFPELSPDELARSLGLNIAPTEHPAWEAQPVLGLYRPQERQIVTYEKNISDLETFIVRNGLEDMTPKCDVRTTVIYHEIFHAQEETIPDIFTRSDMLKRRLLGLIPYRRGLAGASEVGAIHFSKLMARLDYSPCIFERYLLLGKGQIASCRLATE